jgi:small subunit ribosomal protein S9
MSLASTSNLRNLRSLAVPLRIPYAHSLRTYSPPGLDGKEHPRPNRPASPNFFTGRPALNDAIANLEISIKATQSLLRNAYIYPLPTSLPALQAPRVSWHSAQTMSKAFKTELKVSQYRRVVTLLNELHQLRHVAEMAGSYDVVKMVDGAVGVYEREDRDHGKDGKEGDKQVDEFGRSYAMGRRKESSARVWIIPAKGAAGILDQPADVRLTKPVSEGESPLTEEDSPSSSSTPTEPISTSQILINHLPLPLHFPRPADRELVLRPLRLTGLLGAYNIFALTRGGGTTGQAGAIALGVARALAGLREDVKSVLEMGALLFV